MKKYIAQLKNRNATFDSLLSNSIKQIKDWARGRGYEYTLTISNNSEHCRYDTIAIYNVRNNRITKGK